MAGIVPARIGTASANVREGCRADPDARVAELEATSARKSGFQVFGQVNRALMLRDEAFTSEAMDADNGASSAQCQHYGASIDGIPCAEYGKKRTPDAKSPPEEPRSAVVLGTRIQF
ncbi:MULTISPECIES: hypothetical protein [Rhodomicrobium]|uniref:hypothetical protein n=1 Tax=Rhodomicrobium TaxID=1068 RepID=UPI000F73B248|nr:MULTISPECIES: hypothetical protein [Rhodomicrobium]